MMGNHTVKQDPNTEAEMQQQPDHGEESYRGSGRLAGKAAIITGADSGIGKAVAIAFAREGADVLVSFLPGEEKDAAETQRLIEQAGQQAVLVAGDITDEGQCQQIVRRAVQAFGKIDVLINNAGFQKEFASLEEMDSQTFDKIMRTNIYAPFYLCKAAVPHMQAGGAIINTASIQAYDPSPSLLPYSSSKGALITFTKGLALMLAERGIRVTAVAPGPVWTPLVADSTEDPVDFGTKSPLERPAQPAELAGIYVLLASDEGSYMSGGVYPVTGGKLTP